MFFSSRTDKLQIISSSHAIEQVSGKNSAALTQQGS